MTITIDDRSLRMLQDCLKISLKEWESMRANTKVETLEDKVNDYAMRIQGARHCLGMSTYPTDFVIGYVEKPWEIISMS